MDTDHNQIDASQVEHIRRELRTARNEINNLRQQIKSLKFSQNKEIDDLITKLTNWQCSNCAQSSTSLKSDASPSQPDHSDGSFNPISLTPIGILSTCFPKKRAAPKQPGLCLRSQGKLTLFNSVFTNPDHALEGLSGYSHMWILFHFDRNESNHIHAKVAPPRLNGERTGVFATRSPHRPCPIGLSLVHIDLIQESTIYFSGVDMLDGTPVFDIKPYIPRYDNPLHQTDSDIGDDKLDVVDISVPPGSPGVCPGYREAPDGEDSDQDYPATPSVVLNVPGDVRVPPWVNSDTQLTVEITAEAQNQLEVLEKSDLQPVIKSVLQEDPRSVYLKQRYSNQFYTFLIADLHVSCKFNDNLHAVIVYRVSQAGKLCECGEQEWQCSNHGVMST